VCLAVDRLLIAYHLRGFQGAQTQVFSIRSSDLVVLLRHASCRFDRVFPRLLKIPSLLLITPVASVSCPVVSMDQSRHAVDDRAGLTEPSIRSGRMIYEGETDNRIMLSVDDVSFGKDPRADWNIEDESRSCWGYRPRIGNCRCPSIGGFPDRVL
jgi:hypothetical protein